MNQFVPFKQELWELLIFILRLCKWIFSVYIALVFAVILLFLRSDIFDHDQWDEGGAAPLHRAAAAKNIGRIRWLLFWGADINQCDRWGKTPIFYAVAPNGLQSQGCKETVYLLYCRGAKLNIHLANGETLEDHAKTTDMKKFLDELKNRELKLDDADSREMF